MASSNYRTYSRSSNHRITGVYVLDDRGRLVKELKEGMQVDTPKGPGVIHSYLRYDDVWQVRLNQMTPSGSYFVFSWDHLTPIDDLFNKVLGDSNE